VGSDSADHTRGSASRETQAKIACVELQAMLHQFDHGGVGRLTARSASAVSWNCVGPILLALALIIAKLIGRSPSR
jgi:hypothetical protein